MSVFLAVVLALGLMVSCDIFGSINTPEPETVVHRYTSVSNGTTYILEIFQKVAAARATGDQNPPAIYNPAAGDT